MFHVWLIFVEVTGLGNKPQRNKKTHIILDIKTPTEINPHFKL